MLSYVMEFACMCLYLANLCISNAIVESLVQLIMTIDLQTTHCTTKIPSHSSMYMYVFSLLYMLCVDRSSGSEESAVIRTGVKEA